MAMKNVLKKAALAAAALVGFSGSAHAYPYVVLTLTDFNVTTNSISVQKSCSSFDAASVAACSAAGFGTSVGSNQIQFGTTLQFLGGGFAASGLLGDFTITSTSAVSNTPGTPVEGTTNRSQTEASRAASGNGDVHRLLVDFVAYGYTDPNALDKLLSASAGITANLGSFAPTDKVTSFFSVDKDNGLAATASLGCTLTVASSPLNESCGLGPIPWTDNGGMYSLRSIQSFDMAVGSRLNSTANSKVSNVPEPTTAALLAVAMIGLGVAARRGSKRA
jgi:hypothetical protein